MGQKKLRLRALVPGVAMGTEIPIDVTELTVSSAEDFDASTVLALRAFVKLGPGHPGFFSQLGEFKRGSTTMTGTYSAPFGSNGAAFKNVTYTPREKGYHTLIVTGVEGGVGHTYRTGVVKVT